MSSARAIEAGKAIVRVSLDRSAVDRGIRDMEARFRAASSVIGGIGKQLLGVGAGMTGTIAGVVTAASKFEETFSKFQVVFRDNATSVREWSEAVAKELGRSKLQVLDFMASSQDLFIPLNFDEATATALSKQLTVLAADLGSFNNRADADVLRDLHAALTGSGEVMKKYGVIVSEAAVKQELFNLGINPKRASDQQKVQARLNIIMAGTTAAHGDAIRTAGSFANQMKRLHGIIVDFSVTAGTPLLDVLSTITRTLGEIVVTADNFVKKNQEMVITVAAAAAGTVGLGASLYATSLAISSVNVVMTVARAATTALGFALKALRVISISMFASWIAFQAAIYAATAAVYLSIAAIRAYGAQAIAATTVTKTWTITTIAAGAAVKLLRNSVMIAKSAFHGLSLVIGVLRVRQALATGSFLAAALAMKSVAASSVALSTILGIQSSVINAVSAAQNVASLSSLGLAGTLAKAAVAGGIAASSGSLLGVAWTAAAAAVEVAQAIMTGGISSLIKIAGVGLVAVTGALMTVSAAYGAGKVASEEMGSAWGYLMQSLSGIFSVVKEVSAGLREALAAGQYLTAAKTLWAGLKQLFWMGVKETLRLFRVLPARIMSIMKHFGKTFIDTLWRLFTSIPTLLKKALSGEGIGDAINAIFAGGDWLDGVATEGIKNARGELKLLRAEVAALQAKKVADEKAQKDQQDRETSEKLARGESLATPSDGEAETVKLNDAHRKMQELNDQIRELTLGADAAADKKIADQLRADGKSEEDIAADLASIRALRDRKRALEAEKEASEDASKALLDKLDREADSLSERGFGVDEIFKAHMEDIDNAIANSEISQEQADDAREKAQQDRDDRAAARAEEGRQLADELRTPLEKFQDEMERIEGLRSDGVIDSSTASRAAARARKNLAQQTQPTSSGADQKLGIARRGSKSAIETLARTRGIGGDGASQAPPWVAPMTQAARMQMAATTEMPARFAQAMTQATQKAIDTKKLEELNTDQLTELRSAVRRLDRIQRNTSRNAATEEI